MKRITVRFNDEEEKRLELFKECFGIDDDAKAIKFGFQQAQVYLDFVTTAFIPANYRMVLLKKTKQDNVRRGRIVYD